MVGSPLSVGKPKERWPTVDHLPFDSTPSSIVLFGCQGTYNVAAPIPDIDDRNECGGHINVNESLQQGSKGSTGGLHGTRVRAFLVISQVWLSLLLLAGAGLLIKSFFNLRATSPGFDPTRLLTLDHVIPRARYPEPDQWRRFYEQLIPKLATLPGVESASAANP